MIYTILKKENVNNMNKIDLSILKWEYGHICYGNMVTYVIPKLNKKTKSYTVYDFIVAILFVII